MPIIINKSGAINMELYNFIYYKSVLPITEYLNIFKYNYYYLSGLNSIVEKTETRLSQETNEKCKNEEEIIKDDNIDKRLNELENKLGKCINNKNVEDDDLELKEIKPFDMYINDKIKNISSNFFSFLF